MERWKVVPGMGGRYEVSDKGRVRTVPLAMKKILRQEKSNNGYLRVVLRTDGKGKHYSIHRLVLYAFIGEQPSSLVVNHRDGNRENNSLDNLEYLTHKENSFHARHVLGKPGGNNNNKPVKQYTLQGEFIEQHGSLLAAFRKTGINQNTITKICRKKNKKIGKYLWEYA